MSNSRWGFSTRQHANVRNLLGIGCSICLWAFTLPVRAQYDLIHLGTATSGYGMDVAVDGNYAFVASYGGIRVFDIFDAMHPTLVAATNTGIPYVYDSSITIAGDYALTGAGRDTDFHVYNISNPAQPFPVTNVFSGNYVSEIMVTGKIAYVANTAEGFSVYDFSDPSMPLRVTNFIGTSASCVTVADQHAYVGGGGMIRVYNVTNPFAPVEVGRTNAPQCAAIAVMNHHAFLAHWGGIAVFDVSDPLSPFEVTPGLPIGRVEDLVVSGHFLFAANWTAGVRMYDISNPSQPREIAHVNTTGYAPASQGVYLSGNYLYVASGNTGFYVCAIMPRLQAVVDNAGQPWIKWAEPFSPGISIEHGNLITPGLWSLIGSDPIHTNGYCWLKPTGGESDFFRLCLSP